MAVIKNNLLGGCLFAATAALIWSGNFIVARGIASQVPPISIAFYRWSVACIFLAPIAFMQVKQQWHIIKKHLPYFFVAGFAGITLFNTCLYVAGHYTQAINIALLGTATSPIISVILARIFLKEKIGAWQLIGLLICISGILFLLSKGSINTLVNFKFSLGDKWVLLAALAFAVYNVMVKKKPKEISAIPFLFTVFCAGTLLIVPFYLWEIQHSVPVVWTTDLLWIILYIGLGASVLAFLLWNKAVERLGAAKTALFGYLIPIFSSIEAMQWLHEKITWIHLLCGALVISGLVIANLGILKKQTQ
jgi:drug/metabolite transporter (DMT)-like permease